MVGTWQWSAENAAVMSLQQLSDRWSISDDVLIKSPAATDKLKSRLFLSAQQGNIWG